MMRIEQLRAGRDGLQQTWRELRRLHEAKAEALAAARDPRWTDEARSAAQKKAVARVLEKLPSINECEWAVELEQAAALYRRHAVEAATFTQPPGDHASYAERMAHQAAEQATAQRHEARLSRMSFEALKAEMESATTAQNLPLLSLIEREAVTRAAASNSDAATRMFAGAVSQAVETAAVEHGDEADALHQEIANLASYVRHSRTALQKGTEDRSPTWANIRAAVAAQEAAGLAGRALEINRQTGEVTFEGDPRLGETAGNA